MESWQFDGKAIPCPRSEADVAAMPLDATEGYVFSRMDGVLTVAEICAACSLSDAAAATIINKLSDLGAIDVLAEVEQSAPPKSKKKNAKGSGQDVSDALRQRIEEMLATTEESNYYEMLGVSHDAKRGALRDAYFDLSKEFHPDAYYGKDLGDFRAKMETVFGRLAEAYETLSRKKRRARYDEYIADQIKAYEIEKRLAQVPSLVLYRPKTSHQEPATPSSTPLPPPTPLPEAVAEPAQIEQRAQTPTPSRAPKPAAKLGPQSDLHAKLRRQKGKRLAKNLLKMAGKKAKKKESAPTPRPSVLAPSTAEQQLALRYTVAGVDALERNEFMAALKHFQLALELTPEDQRLLEVAGQAREAASQALAKTYERQGEFEQETGQYVRAASSYLKALDLRKDDHRLMHAVAFNLLRGGGNLKKAEEHAKTAAEMVPQNVDYMVTLGEIFLEVGQQDAGRQKLAAALELDPTNERVAALRRGQS